MARKDGVAAHLDDHGAHEFFHWAKRYFGLEAARWRGLVAAYQQTILVYSVMLGMALVAHRYQRPELAGSRAHVLAIKTVQ